MLLVQLVQEVFKVLQVAKVFLAHKVLEVPKDPMVFQDPMEDEVRLELLGLTVHPARLVQLVFLDPQVLQVLLVHVVCLACQELLADKDSLVHEVTLVTLVLLVALESMAFQVQEVK